MNYSYILENFKAIASYQKIPIKPITLVFGPNSSGKSSLIHSLLLVNEAMNTGELDINKTKIGEDSVDIGGFHQYVYGRDINKKVRWGVEIEVESLTKRLQEILLGVNSIRVELLFGLKQHMEENYEEKPSVLGYIIYTDDEKLIELNKNIQGQLKVKKIYEDNPVIHRFIKIIVNENTTTTNLTEDDIENLKLTIRQLRKSMQVFEGTFLPEKITFQQETKKNSFFYPISKGKRTEDLSKAVSLILPWIISELISQINELIENEINKLQYLGPLRSYPPRHFTLLDQADSKWMANGSNTWEILRKDKDVREAVNRWLGAENRLKTPYQLIVRDLIDMQQFNTHLNEYFNNINLQDNNKKIISDLESMVKSYGIKKLNEIILLDKRSNTAVTHRDVGIGISQILPVLVSAYSSIQKTIAIEQPELHLHPALQAELGDVFIEAALGERKNTFILETHSEHLILRIMRRIRETTANKRSETLPSITPNDVSILFVEPLNKNQGSIIRVLELDEEGELLDQWPGGFFEEGFRERFS
ncbi:DUF3696 domain-containing protein [Bacillus cereus]|uniref:DUF3696 domain-containing protein n=1 Tax=Bacillus cereus TaxID=1396 RepID=UPI000B4BCBEC|nr:DUF3696 domain-containing protein [Bacillus cereus]EKS8379611.1 DUF3696 domain-containing protein [Bacillus cereus]EKS8384702.1 DUF3696 domain-containing protein [Bacillus cereus]EMA7399727.1 DUF3696 domain-containing protein [Bacillus cereus]EMA7401306.1 DUF3696 domain-containing protein [Bacillus cereus]